MLKRRPWPRDLPYGDVARQGTTKIMAAAWVAVGASCSSSTDVNRQNVAVAEVEAASAAPAPTAEANSSASERAQILQRLEALEQGTVQDLAAVQPVVVAGSYLSCIPAVSEQTSLLACDYGMTGFLLASVRYPERFRVSDGAARLIVESGAGQATTRDYHEVDIRRPALGLTAEVLLPVIKRFVIALDTDQDRMGTVYAEIPVRYGQSPEVVLRFVLPLGDLHSVAGEQMKVPALAGTGRLPAAERFQFVAAQNLPHEATPPEVNLAALYEKLYSGDMNRALGPRPTAQKAAQLDTTGDEGGSPDDLGVARKKVIYLERASERLRREDGSLARDELAALSTALRSKGLELDVQICSVPGRGQYAYDPQRAALVSVSTQSILGGCRLADLDLVIWNGNGITASAEITDGGGLDPVLAEAILDIYQVQRASLYLIGDDLYEESFNLGEQLQQRWLGEILGLVSPQSAGSGADADGPNGDREVVASEVVVQQVTFALDSPFAGLDLMYPQDIDFFPPYAVAEQVRQVASYGFKSQEKLESGFKAAWTRQDVVLGRMRRVLVQGFGIGDREEASRIVALDPASRQSLRTVFVRGVRWALQLREATTP